MSKYKLSYDFKPSQTFRLELSNDQMSYITSKLPPGYSFVLQPKKSLPKYVIQQAAKKKNAIYQSEDSNSVAAHQIKSEAQNNKKNVNLPVLPTNTKQVNTQKLGAQKNINANNKWMQTLTEGLKRAAKILTLLKAHKSSWPFHEPVDAQALQIPEYYEVIKEPMDLHTIQTKLKTEKYSDFNEFHADVMKIIENSYRFNEANQEYLKITSQFQNVFTKLLNDPTQDTKNNSKNNKKKKKSSVANRQANDSGPVTLMEKKQLAQQIRRLGKEHLKGIKAIVFDHAEQQEDMFDLQKLSQKKLRELQKYVRNKIIAMEERNRNSQIQKAQISNLNNYESDESSFLTDSSIEA